VFLVVETREMGSIEVDFYGKTLLVDIGNAKVLTKECLARKVCARIGVRDATELEVFVRCRGFRKPIHALVGVNDPISCRFRVGGLVGGKGGMGALLRQKARRSAEITTDFGACRDLNGRRLRHVNNEIRLQVWRQEVAAKKEEGWDSEHSKLLKTPSGIKNWFLTVPNWAELKQTSPQKRKERIARSEFCKDWQEAREYKSRIPPGAPRWWGCPRGEGCPYFHKFKPRDEGSAPDPKRLRMEKDMRNFVKQVEEIEEGMSASILAGIQQSKRAALEAKASPVELGPGPGKASSSSTLFSLAGHILAGETGEIVGQGEEFNTVIAPEFPLSEGIWYLEVEIVAEEKSPCIGSAQIGWINENFELDPNLSDCGVGDLPNSWAFDPVQGKLFAEGKEVALQEFDSNRVVYGGGVIGCQLDLQTGATFTWNGQVVGITEIYESEAKHFFVPALSLEKDVMVRANFGSRDFKFKPPNISANGICGNGGIGKMLFENSTQVKSEGNAKREEEEKISHQSFERIDLDEFGSSAELEKLGMDHLKFDLEARNLKCGGTVRERAERLLSVKGIPEDEIDPTLRPRTKKRKK